MYNPKDIIEILAGNVTPDPEPLRHPEISSEQLVERTGASTAGGVPAVTGLMYQFVPYIETATSLLEKFEDRPWPNGCGLDGIEPKRLGGLGLAMITPGAAKKRARPPSGISPESSPNPEWTFIIDLDWTNTAGSCFTIWVTRRACGACPVCGRPAKEAGVQKIITVDPHTTYALKVLYPQYAGEQFEVRTYFELANVSSSRWAGPVTLHDPCFYGRYLELSRRAAKGPGKDGH